MTLYRDSDTQMKCEIKEDHVMPLLELQKRGESDVSKPYPSPDANDVQLLVPSAPPHITYRQKVCKPAVTRTGKQVLCTCRGKTEFRGFRSLIISYERFRQLQIWIPMMRLTKMLYVVYRTVSPRYQEEVAENRGNWGMPIPQLIEIAYKVYNNGEERKEKKE